MKKPPILCIYCKQWCPPPKKLGEHIILDGLGGKATIKDVCSQCNTFLGQKVDEEFLRKSLVAYRRLLDPQVTEGEVGAVQFLETDWGFIDGRLHNEPRFKALPQALHAGNQLCLVAASEGDRELLKSAILEVKEKGVEAVHTAVRDIPENVPPRLVVNRKKNDLHLVRARSQDEVDALLRLLRVGQFKEGQTVNSSSSSLGLRLSIDPNIPGRCAAKMAFNASCYVFGSSALASDQYDPVRNYILGLDVLEGQVIAANDEPGLRIDDRFVDDMNADQDEALRGDAHHYEIIIGDKQGYLCAVVSLFGGAERFWVRLGPIPDGQQLKLPVCLIRLEEGDFWFLFHKGTGWFHGQPPIWPLERGAPLAAELTSS